MHISSLEISSNLPVSEGHLSFRLESTRLLYFFNTNPLCDFNFFFSFCFFFFFFFLRLDGYSILAFNPYRPKRAQSKYERDICMYWWVNLQSTELIVLFHFINVSLISKT